MMMDLTLVKKHFTPTSILDIGANTGQFYHECKQVFPHAAYLLIEGNPECEDALKGLGVPYEIALLSKQGGEAPFFMRKNEPRCTGNSLYREVTHYYSDEELKVEILTTKTLDAIMEEKKIVRFDLIKMDTQGSELDIISGGHFLCKEALGILLEVSETVYNTNAPLRGQVEEFMYNFGFYPAEELARNQHNQVDILFLNEKYF